MERALGHLIVNDYCLQFSFDMVENVLSVHIKPSKSIFYQAFETMQRNCTLRCIIDLAITFDDFLGYFYLMLRH